MNKDFDFKKSLGQNFLIDKNIVNKIITSIDASEKDLILEIGPGEGAITKELIKLNSTLYSFEIDTRLKDRLDCLTNQKTHIIFEDFLKVDLKNLINKLKYNKLYVVGNLPYYITTPIIKKIIKEIESDYIIIMMQKEVADRFMAKPCTREYGSISVYLQYYFDISKVCVASKTCFNPQPKVDSVVLKFSKRNREEIKNQLFFETLLKDSFQFKRKNLKNNLRKYDLNLIELILNKNGKSLNNRAEEITVQEYIEISNKIC